MNNARRVDGLGDRRSGLVSVVVLIALIVIAIIAAGLLKVSSARRAAVKADERRAQAALLADSGLDRALSRLASSSDYSGETWEITTEDLGGRGPARVSIRVEKPTDRPDRRQVRVEADFPANSTLRSRESRDAFVPIILPPR